MICEILSVGTELLLGQILNSDAQYLSTRLSELGITVYRHVTVGDNAARVKEALMQALSRSDLVITTGGLGPTEDDLTKETVAETLGLPMRLDEASLESIRSYFTAVHREMTENNVKQAYLPESATVMPNACGTAPGCIVEKDGKTVAVLPGPPHELVSMYELQLEPYLRARTGETFHSEFLRIVGVGESQVETTLLDLFHGDNPTLALYCKPGDVQARVTARVPRGVDPEPLIAPIRAEIKKRLGASVYAEGRDTTMPETVLGLLRARGETLALAESCTGGLIASSLVSYPGASDALLTSLVTYSNDMKRALLGVTRETLDTHGAVSEACAREMAEGARRVSGADWALSVTGVAGPGGGTKDKPVGTVYVGLCGKGACETTRLSLRGDRTRVRELTCLYALNLLRLRLIG